MIRELFIVILKQILETLRGRKAIHVLIIIAYGYLSIEQIWVVHFIKDDPTWFKWCITVFPILFYLMVLWVYYNKPWFIPAYGALWNKYEKKYPEPHCVKCLKHLSPVLSCVDLLRCNNCNYDLPLRDSNDISVGLSVIKNLVRQRLQEKK